MAIGAFTCCCGVKAGGSMRNESTACTVRWTCNCATKHPGAEGDSRLHGFRGDTGEPVFAGGGSNEVMTGLRHFQTLIAAQNRLFVASDGRLYAFAF